MQCIFSASKVERMIWFVCKLKWKVCNKVECVHRSWLSFSMQHFSAVQTEDMTSPSTPRNFSFTWISSIWFWFLQQIKSRHAVGTRMHGLELSKPLISKTSHLLAMSYTDQMCTVLSHAWNWPKKVSPFTAWCNCDATVLNAILRLKMSSSDLKPIERFDLL